MLPYVPCVTKGKILDDDVAHQAAVPAAVLVFCYLKAAATHRHPPPSPPNTVVRQQPPVRYVEVHSWLLDVYHNLTPLCYYFNIGRENGAHSRPVGDFIHIPVLLPLPGTAVAVHTYIPGEVPPPPSHIAITDFVSVATTYCRRSCNLPVSEASVKTPWIFICI